MLTGITGTMGTRDGAQECLSSPGVAISGQHAADDVAQVRDVVHVRQRAGDEHIALPCMPYSLRRGRCDAQAVIALKIRPRCVRVAPKVPSGRRSRGRQRRLLVNTPLTGRTGIGPGAAAGAAVSIGAPEKRD